MIVKLLTEHHLEFLSLKGDSKALPGLHVRIPRCWKSHARARLILSFDSNAILVITNLGYNPHILSLFQIYKRPESKV